ncbi:MAG: dihydrofolate reductase family protein [Polyangiaceae bacterium]
MRKILMFNRVSADGSFASQSGDLSWVVPDDAIDQGGAERMPEVDAMLFGRTTYQAFESFWPHALKDATTAEDPHAAGRRSPTLRAMAGWINRTEKLVFSRTLKRMSWQNSRLLGEFEPGAVQALKERPGKNIIIFGSGSIVSRLTEHALIDEYQFVVGPLLLGSGRPLLSGVQQSLNLELLEVKAYDSGNVVLRYARKH